jgi:extradiol dioxygenase family protein
MKQSIAHVAFNVSDMDKSLDFYCRVLKFEKAFEMLDYIKIEDTPDRIVYRKKSKFSRLAQWYEDEITVSLAENPVIISGFRKWIIRIDRVIDQLILKESK